MARTTVEVRTDENGYFSKTLLFSPRGPSAATIQLSATLLSPFSTGVWGTVDIDPKDGKPSNQRRAFVVWHSETVQIGSWSVDAGEKVIILNGKTNPTRPNARLLLEIDIGT